MVFDYVPESSFTHDGVSGEYNSEVYRCTGIPNMDLTKYETPKFVRWELVKVDTSTLPTSQEVLKYFESKGGIINNVNSNQRGSGGYDEWTYTHTDNSTVTWRTDMLTNKLYMITPGWRTKYETLAGGQMARRNKSKFAIRTGPKGGKYYIKAGKKVYV